MIESLESRALLSAVLDPSAGVLTITGSNNGDSIEVMNLLEGGGGAGYAVKINGVLTTFNREDVQRIVIDGRGGSDILRAGAGPFEPGGETVPVLVIGGGGNDTIENGAGGATIRGGAGDDRISAGDGNDRIFGNAGRDQINDGPGDDTVSAGDGNDIVWAGLGNDVIFGGEGEDFIIAGPGSAGGADTISGGPGRDVVGFDRTDTVSDFERKLRFVRVEETSLVQVEVSGVRVAIRGVTINPRSGHVEVWS